MRFKDRTEAGKLLAEVLERYQNQDVVVYALPRGGVISAVEIAKRLHAPLDLIITQKISHPNSPEYAIAATAENGHIIGTRRELMTVDEDWLESEIEKKRIKAADKRKKFLSGRKKISPRGRTAILVDDGVATGLTLRVGILELKHHKPQKIIVAVPIAPKSTAEILKREADELVALEIPSDDTFLGAVGAYYDDFRQVEDDQVVQILEGYDKWLQKEKASNIFTVRNGKKEYDIFDFDEP